MPHVLPSPTGSPRPPDPHLRRFSSGGNVPYSTYSNHAHARSEPYLAQSNTVIAPSAPPQVRPPMPPPAPSAPLNGASGPQGLVPLDEAVRLRRARTARPMSTSSLPQMIEARPMRPPSQPVPPELRQSRSSTSSDRFSLQSVARKLTKPRRSASGYFGPPVPPSPPPPAQVVRPHPAQSQPQPQLRRPPSGYNLSQAPQTVSTHARTLPTPRAPTRAPSQASMHSAAPLVASPASLPPSLPTSPYPTYHTSSLTQSPGRHYFPSNGQPQFTSPYPPYLPPPPAPPAMPLQAESDQDQLERARRESLRAEEERLAKLAAEEERLLSATLAESSSSAQQERARAEAFELRAMQDVIRDSREQEELRLYGEERRRKAEEDAVLRALAASQNETAVKGKGRAYDGSSSWQNAANADDEALELAMRLSLDEDAHRTRWRQEQSYTPNGPAETSSQAFERFSRPTPSPQAGPSVPPRPPRPPPSRSFLDPELDREPPSPLLPPPAYELPPHAAELDQPGDVIVGPCRPLPASPSPVATSHGPLPVPPLPGYETDLAAHAAAQLRARGDPLTAVGLEHDPPAPVRVEQPFPDWHPSRESADVAEGNNVSPPEPAHDPFDDRFEDVSFDWTVETAATSSPDSPEPSGSGLPPPEASSGRLSLFDAVLARRVSQGGAYAPEQGVPDPVGSPNRSAFSTATATDEPSLRRRPLPVPMTSLSAPTTPLHAPAALFPPPSAPPTVSAPQTPLAAPAQSIPSYGGYVEEASSVFASERILREVRWGFVDVDLSKSGRRPPLQYEGDFPRGAQLSLLPDSGGRPAYASFAVEARTWQGLLVYLMWHGDSRFEAAPFDLERDKGGRGYQATVSLDFYRAPSTSQSAVSIRPPRVRARLTLLPLSEAPPSHPTSAAVTSLSVLSTPSFDSVNPNIRLDLTLPPTLPFSLSALASLLIDTHSTARRAVQASPARPGKAVATVPPTPGQQALVQAVDLFRRLGGEEAAGRPTEQAPLEDEASLLHRMKARIRRRKGVQQNAVDPNEDLSEGLPLPEGALLITPFLLDRYE